MKFEVYLFSIYPVTVAVGKYETRCHVTIVLSSSSRDAACVSYCTMLECSLCVQTVCNVHSALCTRCDSFVFYCVPRIQLGKPQVSLWLVVILLPTSLSVLCPFSSFPLCVAAVS